MPLELDIHTDPPTPEFDIIQGEVERVDEAIGKLMSQIEAAHVTLRELNVLRSCFLAGLDHACATNPDDGQLDFPFVNGGKSGEETPSE
ncbi:MAG: hypothetical protein CMA72_08995 [Euryarchaeota archaeon]|nr:hypothetical protein [Euryarchaeota archaeon]|tara:strand:+ start:112 stop:378 length:267 start_codon:yes stop_codon:yes gene_type:complete